MKLRKHGAVTFPVCKHSSSLLWFCKSVHLKYLLFISSLLRREKKSQYLERRSHTLPFALSRSHCNHGNGDLATLFNSVAATAQSSLLVKSNLSGDEKNDTFLEACLSVWVCSLTKAQSNLTLTAILNPLRSQGTHFLHTQYAHSAFSPHSHHGNHVPPLALSGSVGYPLARAHTHALRQPVCGFVYNENSLSGL